MPPETKTARNELILKQYATTGRTLASIADECRLSVERIRQIIKRTARRQGIDMREYNTAPAYEKRLKKFLTTRIQP
jgi:DNA-directed RNA polymerase sigma subunit (sigma70/sigma32)